MIFGSFLNNANMSVLMKVVAGTGVGIVLYSQTYVLGRAIHKSSPK